MANLGSEDNNINIDGGVSEYTDFGGNDTYTILGSLSGDVQITDNQASTINLPNGLEISDAQFLSDGLQFTINGNTLTLLGDPSQFTFVFGGTPIDATAGTPQSFDATAGAFGTTVPGPGEGPNAATTTGAVNADGSVGESDEGLVDLSGQTEVVAEDGVPETFVLEFDSSSGNALSSDAVVSITGFDPAEDILRFDDANAPAQDAATFLNGAGGAAVFSNGFDGETIISFQDDNTADSVPPAQVTLVGITDASLGGADPFFEVV